MSKYIIITAVGGKIPVSKLAYTLHKNNGGSVLPIVEDKKEVKKTDTPKVEKKVEQVKAPVVQDDISSEKKEGTFKYIEKIETKVEDTPKKVVKKTNKRNKK